MFLQREDCQLFYQCWPVEEPQAAVILSHGLGEHVGRYQHLAEYLNQFGYAVYGLDHRGHGQSDGQRGHVDSFRQYTDDLHGFAAVVSGNHPRLRMHLFGHSMGALIATAYVLRHAGMSSLILCAPAYATYGLCQRLKVRLSPYLAALLPRASLCNDINARHICRTPAVVQAYKDDPLVHSYVSPAWGAAYFREQRFIAARAGNVDIPLLMLVAGDDRLTDPLVSQARFQQFSSTPKHLEFYPDAYHEVLNEQHEGELVRHEIVRWLQRHGEPNGAGA